ncbi:related to carboxypeptidase [Phialocephala subalpina]|uniref:Carboxypeptidase n=1 Tax=Phialocephala subalpina TaxID=576137 RepID=A0A1L7WWH1_9HELO|nr:related to carboxypeptidase [Phialocephala subalpina]
MHLLLLSFLLTITLAQFPPGSSNVTTILSPVDGNISISYRVPDAGICETAFADQQQYTGWVHVPGNYSTNTFFWFISARDPTDQLTIWLNGGPGSSSMLGLFTENGPCEVIEEGLGKLGTQVRDWGWDRGSNILYIDQPNQVGFSYDTPTNGSLDLLTSDLYTPPQVLPSSQPASTFMNGTFSSLNVNNTANTTDLAGMAIWHMLQGFLGAFPQYAPNGTSLGVHLFAESYGGKYGPAFATIWEEQNRRRSNGTISKNGTIEIKLASLGIINGCVDDLIQAPYYPAMAVNNTFGLTAINPTRAKLAVASFYATGGCQDLINRCRTAVNAQDPENDGDVSVVNSICSNAYTSCLENVMEPYYDAGRSVYDIAHYLPDPFPPSTYLDYLNTASILEAIGSPVNFTQTNQQVVSAFQSTGDYERQALVPDIAALLNQGVRVGLMYGDRDYICNWLGGEAISLAVAAQTSPSYASIFPNSGYAPIIVNTSYIGGVVRQYGNLSFSRIYDAGHSVPAYQPETAFQVFARIMTGTSISTGEIINRSVYNTSGPLNATHTASLPASPSATCWLRNIPDTCNGDQKNMIVNNEGVIINGILYDASSDWSSPGASATPTAIVSGGSVTVTTTTEVLTGFYTATATPSTTKKSFGVPSFKLHSMSFALPFIGALAVLI